MTYETQKRPLKCELEQQLEEATALLVVFKDCCADEPRERLRAFLSRAPAQPAAPAPHPMAGSEINKYNEPAAPTPEAVASSIASAAHLRAYGTDLGPWIDSVESRLQPAAPEPSGHTYCQRCQAMAGAMCGICRSFRVTAAESRAESAEAKHAAVRSLLDGWNAMGRAKRGAAFGLLTTLTALTAPSPGAGEETL